VLVDRGRDAVHDDLADVGPLRELADVVDVLLRELEVLDLGQPAYVVGFDHRREDREAVFHVQLVVVVVGEDACDFDLVARPGNVDAVPQQDHILLARHAPCWHFPGRLLHRYLLVVPVDGLGLVQLKRAVLLAMRAGPELGLLVVVEEDRALAVAAPHAQVVSLLQLGKYGRALRDYALNLYQVADVLLPKVSQLVHDFEPDDLHVDLGVDVLVAAVVGSRALQSDRVEVRKQHAWLVRDPHGERRICLPQMAIVDLQTLLVLVAHLLHLLQVDQLVARLGVPEIADEPLKGLADPPHRSRLLYPDVQLAYL